MPLDSFQLFMYNRSAQLSLNQTVLHFTYITRDRGARQDLDELVGTHDDFIGGVRNPVAVQGTTPILSAGIQPGVFLLHVITSSELVIHHINQIYRITHNIQVFIYCFVDFLWRSFFLIYNTHELEEHFKHHLLT